MFNFVLIKKNLVQVKFIIQIYDAINCRVLCKLYVL